MKIIATVKNIDIMLGNMRVIKYESDKKNWRHFEDKSYLFENNVVYENENDEDNNDVNENDTVYMATLQQVVRDGLLTAIGCQEGILGRVQNCQSDFSGQLNT